MALLLMRLKAWIVARMVFAVAGNPSLPGRVEEGNPAALGPIWSPSTALLCASAPGLGTWLHIHTCYTHMFI